MVEEEGRENTEEGRKVEKAKEGKREIKTETQRKRRNEYEPAVSPAPRLGGISAEWPGQGTPGTPTSLGYGALNSASARFQTAFPGSPAFQISSYRPAASLVYTEKMLSFLCWSW